MTEKKETVITFVIDPQDPQPGDSFTIIGSLKTTNDEILGNKWIILESTAAGKRPGAFQELAHVATDIQGNYYFYRPSISPPETIRVRFDGNYRYSAVMSDSVSVKGAEPGTVVPAQLPGASGSQMVGTILTVTPSSASPKKGESLTLKGTLTSVNGEVLKNQWVILESTALGSGTGDYGLCDKDLTGDDGSFEFVRTNPESGESLRVRYAGDLNYLQSDSQVFNIA